MDSQPPRARDAHLLMIVALRPAGGEGITKPEAVILRKLVRGIGKSCRPFIGGNHQIRIRPILAERLQRMNGLIALEIVRDVPACPG